MIVSKEILRLDRMLQLSKQRTSSDVGAVYFGDIRGPVEMNVTSSRS